MDFVFERRLIFSILLMISIISIQAAYAEPKFSFEFGEKGDENDELDTPTDVVVDKNGKNIYVVDSENNRINVFEDDGDKEDRYGTFCDIAVIQLCNSNADGASVSGDGQFNDPISIAMDALEKFFVVDSDNKRVQVFDDDGEFQFKFGSSNSGDDEYLGLAKGIVIQESSKNIFVSDVVEDSISVFDSTGDFLFKFDSFDGNDDFKNPSNMIIDNTKEMLYVVDSGEDRVVVFELIDDTNCPSGTEESVDGVCFVKKFGSTGDDEGEFDEPTGIAFDSTSDLLYVADTDNDRIQIFKIVSGNTCPSGTEEMVNGVCFVEEFGSRGSGDGEFNSPMGIALDKTNNLLFVADSDNDRIQVFELTAESTTLLPSVPKNLKASPVSSTSIMISWNEPEQLENVPAVSGYKIEHKISGGNYVVITENTESTARSFIHEGLDPDERYSYRVYSVNSEGTSVSTSSVSAKPEGSDVPTAVTAKAISPSQIRVSWLPPSETYNQSVKGYEIKRDYSGEFVGIGSTNGQTRSFVVSNLKTDTTYTFAVSANMLSGSTNESDSASATPREDSVYTSDEEPTQIILAGTISTPPIKLVASVGTTTQVNLEWNYPGDDGNTPITGYKIEVKKDSDAYETLVADSKSTTRSYSHTDLVTKSKYTYRISAINSAGISEPSNEVSATPMLTGIKISPMGKLSIDEGKLLSFTVKLTDGTIKDPIFRLENNPPGTNIVANTGMFTWTPSNSDGGKSYRFDIVAIKDAMSDRQSITITVNDVLEETSEPKEEPKQPEVPTELGIASFVDKSKDPQSYVDRYNSEASYKKWFDDNYSEYSSIYEAVGLETLKALAPFVDESKDPQSYVDRYNSEASYKKWFDDNYSEYSSIYQAVGLEEPKEEVPKVKEKKFGICGAGTKLIDGVCTIVEKPIVKPWWQFW